MATRTDQLICIAKATGSKIYTRESEVGAQGKVKALVLSLKQIHAQYYRLYKKGPTKAMVCLQGLHSSDAFWHLNMSSSVSLKSFCPWCLNFKGNTETIVTHLRMVHYRLAIVCNDLLIICQHVSAGSPGTLIKVQDKVTQEVQVKEVRRSFLKPSAVNLGGQQNA